MEIYDTVDAWQVSIGDGIVVDGGLVEVRDIRDTDDDDEVLVVGYSHESGEVEEFPLVYDQLVQLWSA